MRETAHLIETALRWTDAGRGVALATVVSFTGSSPRSLGSRLVVNDQGGFEGSVSGGCVEAAVIEAALTTIETGNGQLLEFGEHDQSLWSVGLACGGSLGVHIEALSPALIEIYRGMLRDHQERRETERTIGSSTSLRFVERWEPSLRLLLVGAVHIAQSLSSIAKLAEYDVTIIDPRSGFARSDRFPDCDLCGLWPDQGIAAMRPDARTAVITLTHDPKLDDPALMAALDTPAFYIGALGSRRTHANRLLRLAQMGVSAEKTGSNSWTRWDRYRRHYAGRNRHVHHGWNNDIASRRQTHGTESVS